MEIVSKNSNKSKSLVISVLGIIILLILIASVYFIFIKDNKNNNSNNSQNNSQKSDSTNKKKIGNVDADELYDLLLKVDYSNKDLYGATIKTIDDIPYDQKIGNIIDQVEVKNGMVSEKTVKEKYESIYYDNYVAVDRGDTLCNSWTRDKNGNYLVENSGCGSNTISDSAMAEIVSANKDNSKLEMIAYFYIFDLYNNHTLSEYTFKNVILQNESINEKLEDSKELDKFNVSQYEKKFQHYKFTFKYKNGGYKLYSIEPIN